MADDAVLRGTRRPSAGATDGERGVLDSLVADKATARAWGEGMLAAVRSGWHGAKACARST